MGNHINLTEISNLIRRRCGLPLLSENKNPLFLTREEQLIILAKLVQQDELIKSSALNMNDNLASEIAEKIINQLKAMEPDESSKA